MTEPNLGGEPVQPVIRDKRRIDPETGQVREPSPDDHAGAAPTGAAAGSGHASEDLAAARAEAAERTEDLQRLQAEYVNYRRRVDRDRDLARDLAIAEVLESLLPVLDDIAAARHHGELDGPFAAVADKLEATLGRFGAERFGDVGEEFDPTVHEALMHREDPDATATTIELVMQPGYRLGERIVRPARVGVVGPQ